MARTKKIRMTKNWVVMGETWVKGTSYAAEPREVAILVDQEKVAKIVADNDNATT